MPTHTNTTKRPGTALLRHAERVRIKGTSGQQGYRWRQRIQPTPKSIIWSKRKKNKSTLRAGKSFA